MNEHRKFLDEVHARLGHGKLTRSFAKLEILFGLTAAGLGLLLGNWSTSQPVPDWLLATGSLFLFVLGFYLALAGHRSHLYQSNNELTALLLAELRALSKP
ncbi:MAG: hypothetical protein AB7K24_13070 [Gemmataceae bacterium]